MTVDLFVPLLRNLTLVATVAMLYVVVPKRSFWIPEPVVIGLICSFGACLAMADSVQLRPGVFVDARSTMILLSGLFGGPVAAVICTALAAGMRIYIGGAGLLAGTLGIALAGAIGAAVFYWLRRDGRPVSMAHICILAALSPLTFIVVIVLPWDVVMRALSEAFVPTSALRAAGILLLGILLMHERRRVAAEDRIRELANLDELSGLANRRSFYRALDRAIKAHRTSARDFSVVILDLDHFKSINDRYGHPVGDEVIKNLADILRANTQGNDVAARIGGEEFAILLSGAGRDEARKISERIRTSIAESEITVGMERIPFTASLGVAATSTLTSSVNALMSAADTALYIAKQGGRNRVVVEASA
ncbi:GGDEF domain-containing protein [Amorphus sp. MBR-141]